VKSRRDGQKAGNKVVGHVPQYPILSLPHTCENLQHKTTHLQTSGRLQPLPVPMLIWSDLSMDFIEALPCVNNKTMILTVVDHLSKAAHFIPLGHPYTTTLVARAFFDEVVRLHDLPSSIVSDCDPVFTSNLWREPFQFAYLERSYR
jgi:hypothetical protein